MLYNLYLDIWWYVWNCENFLDLSIFLRFSLVYCLANRLCRTGPTTTLSSRSIPKLLRNQLRLRRRRIQQASPNPQQHSTMCVLDKSGNVDNIWEFTFRNVNEPHRITMYINVHQCTLMIINVHHWDHHCTSVIFNSRQCTKCFQAAPIYTSLHVLILADTRWHFVEGHREK